MVTSLSEAAMSARLDQLLDRERLADIARNDALMGIAAPAVEMDEQFFARSDACEVRAAIPAATENH
jgi:hypothetical protein